MIFHEDCALNIEHTLFKGNDLIVIGWAKGDLEISFVINEEVLTSDQIRSERVDVAEYFGISNSECFGFAIFTSKIKPNLRGQVLIRLLDRKTSTYKDILLTESDDYTDGLQLLDGLKERGLPDDFFQEGIVIDDVKYKLGSHVDRRIAVGHIETVKCPKGGKNALIVGWAVSKAPNNLVLKVGDNFLSYERLFSYPRKDIEDAFSKSFGQSARTSGFIGFSAEGGVKNQPVQLFFCRKSTRLLQLVASTDQIEREISYEDLQLYLKGIHTPEITLNERVTKVDGPLARSSLAGTEESAYFIRPDILLGVRPAKPLAQLSVIVPKGFNGDVMQSVMSFAAMKVDTKSLLLNFYFCEVVEDNNLLRDVADRAHALFDCEVSIYNGCTHLALGHIAYTMGNDKNLTCYMIDARSGFEYQQVSKFKVDLQADPEEIRVFFARDVNGISGTGITFELLNRFCERDTGMVITERPAFSRNKVFSIAMQGSTLQGLSQAMGFVSLSELTDVELLIRRSDDLWAKYEIVYQENGLPFARTNQANLMFQDSLSRQVEMYTMAQVGV